MVYTVVLTKKSVFKNTQGIYSINMKAVVNDGTSDVLEINLTSKYNSNAPDLTATENSIKSQFVVAWDKFKSENDVFESTLLNTTVTSLQSQAQAYVNL